MVVSRKYTASRQGMVRTLKAKKQNSPFQWVSYIVLCVEDHSQGRSSFRRTVRLILLTCTRRTRGIPCRARISLAPWPTALRLAHPCKTLLTVSGGCVGPCILEHSCQVMTAGICPFEVKMVMAFNSLGRASKLTFSDLIRGVRQRRWRV